MSDPWLSGRLSERPLPKVLYALAVRRFTGAQTFRAGEADDAPRVTLYWQDGRIVDADSSVADDSLGRTLLAERLLEQAKLTQALRRQAQAPDQSLLAVLVELGFLDAAGAARAARVGLIVRARRVFTLAAPALVEFTTEAGPSGRDAGAGGLDPRFLIYRGLRTTSDAERLRNDLASLAEFAMRLDPAHEAQLGAFGFGDDERVVLAYLVKGYWSVADLVEACPNLPEAAVLALVFALIACELLDVKPGNSVPRLRRRAREATVNVGSAAQAALRAAVNAAQKAPGAALRTARLSEPPPVNAIEPPAPRSTPSTLPPPATSADPAKRLAAKVAAVNANVDHFVLLDLTPQASAVEIKTAYLALARAFHPDRAAGMGMEAKRADFEKVFARLSEANATLADDARRAEYVRILAAGGVDAVRRQEEAEQAKAIAILEAEEHFRIGEMMMRRGQWREALAEFELAVKKNPEEAEHHAYLAWAHWSLATDKPSAIQPAKQRLALALKVNDACAPAYYFLGHVYIVQGDVPRAIGQFQRALDLRPGWVDAERELRLLEQRRAREKKPTLLPFGKKK